MDLSVPSDKLIAFSCIAKNVMPLINGTYVAGMWREYLESTLSWRINQFFPSSRSTEYRAPSWSWASVDGSVTPAKQGKFESWVQVEHVVLSNATEDTTGAVPGGCLDLRGSLKPMKLSETDFGSDRQWLTVGNNRVVCHQDQSIEESKSKRLRLSLDIAPVGASSFDEDNAEGQLFLMLSHSCGIKSSLGLVFIDNTRRLSKDAI
jgi:hypothetical protein